MNGESHYLGKFMPLNLYCIRTHFYISPIGNIPGTSEVSPKLQFPVEPLVTYLRENHGLTQEGAPLIRQFKHGQSNPTYYIAYGERPFT